MQHNKMGIATSSNVQLMLVKDNQELISSIIQQSLNTNNQSQIIDISNIHGDVTITGMNQSQTSTLNMRGVFDASTTDNAQRSFASSTTQSAKSLVKDLNLGSASAASNQVMQYIEVASKIAATIHQTCGNTLTQLQNISISNIAGNVSLTRTGQEQVATSLATCFGKVVSETSAVSDLALKNEQVASASSIGLNMFTILIFIVIFLVGGGMPLLLGYKNLVIFGILAAIGIGIASSGYYTSSQDMKMTIFSPTIRKSCTSPDAIPATEQYETIEQVGKACLDKGYAAFDYIGYETSKDGRDVTAVNDPPKVLFYKSIPKDCTAPFTSQDHVQLIHIPKYGSGSGGPKIDPTGNIYDIWLDTDTSDWYVFEEVWRLRGRFSTLFDKPKAPAAWVVPNVTVSPQTATIFVEPTIAANPALWRVRFADVTKIAPGPGMFTIQPKYNNVSGYKYTKWNLPTILGGLALGMAGIGGGVYSLVRTN